MNFQFKRIKNSDISLIRRLLFFSLNNLPAKRKVNIPVPRVMAVVNNLINI